jgi:hypothetical protein
MADFCSCKIRIPAIHGGQIAVLNGASDESERRQQNPEIREVAPARPAPATFAHPCAAYIRIPECAGGTEAYKQKAASRFCQPRSVLLHMVD